MPLNGPTVLSSARLVLAHPHARWMVGIGLAVLLGALALAVYLLGTRAPPPPGPSQALVLPPVVLPPSDPDVLRPLTPEQAIEANAAIPVTKLAIPAAKPFAIGKIADPDYQRALDCLTAAVYYEAAVEADDGQRAVAQVVLNRVRHPAYPHTVCGVVFQGHERRTGCQFSFTCDGALGRRASLAGWARARVVAEQALHGAVYSPVGWATHYHTQWVVPYWASSLDKLGQVGAHLFYRWTGGWGMPRAFTGAYAGAEPVVAAPFSSDQGIRLAVAGDDSTLDVLPPKLVEQGERPILTNDQPARPGPAHADPAPAAAMAPVPAGERYVLRAPAGGSDPAAPAASGDHPTN